MRKSVVIKYNCKRNCAVFTLNSHNMLNESKRGAQHKGTNDAIGYCADICWMMASLKSFYVLNGF